MSYFRLGTMILLLSSGAAMAAPEAYMINLGPVARDNITKLLAVGRGTADVTLDGTKLTINGKFDGLASNSTDAHLCIGVGITWNGVKALLAETGIPA